METSLSDHSDKLIELQSCCTSLKSQNEKFLDKVDELENQSCHSNVRIVGIPEIMEGSDPVKFMTTFFTEVFGADFFSLPLLLDREH